MRKKFLLGLAFALCVLLGNTSVSYAGEEYSQESAYIYSRNGRAVSIPDAYEYKKSLSLMDIEVDGEGLSSASDMFVSEANKIYILDSIKGVVVRLDEDFNVERIYTEFTCKDGSTTTLKKPEGVYVAEDGTMYIADTENKRILIVNEDAQVQQEILKPENLVGIKLTSFLPTKIVVDSTGRISVVARNNNNGLLQFTKDGEFTGYMGAPSVQVSAMEKLLRKISTDEQRAQMQYYVPTEYNNIKIDEKNFIWGTISSVSAEEIEQVIMYGDMSGKVTPIKKLNTMGKDVLKRKGLFAPVGELYFSDTPSKMTDVALGENGIYTLLDSYYGKLFTYNSDGILLHVSCRKGTKKGQLMTPIAVDYVGSKLYVLDSGLGQILMYSPTTYGSLLIEAEGYSVSGDYDLANETWRKVAERNSNFDYAYVGLGNSEYSAGNYEQAMEYYMNADETEKYSDTKETLRKQQAGSIFPLMFIAIILLVVILTLASVTRRVTCYIKGETYHRRGREDE
ncbi:MAG: hypothetical protein IJZ82_12325 [Lachnospiraceae bacterium]|nr:hypothetical protein [Lachnospiraceae bacterium]